MNFWVGRFPRERWKLWLSGAVLGFVIVASVMALSHKGEFQDACVPPRGVDALGPRIYDSHRGVTVSRGKIITVQLSTGASQVWPWGTPRSSDETVLKPVTLCFDPTNVSSLPVQLTPFIAAAPGKAVITADAISGDRAQDFTLKVTVTP